MLRGSTLTLAYSADPLRSSAQLLRVGPPRVFHCSTPDLRTSLSKRTQSQSVQKKKGFLHTSSVRSFRFVQSFLGSVAFVAFLKCLLHLVAPSVPRSPCLVAVPCSLVLTPRYGASRGAMLRRLASSRRELLTWAQTRGGVAVNFRIFRKGFLPMLLFGDCRPWCRVVGRRYGAQLRDCDSPQLLQWDCDSPQWDCDSPQRDCDSPQLLQWDCGSPQEDCETLGGRMPATSASAAATLETRNELSEDFRKGFSPMLLFGDCRP